MYWGKTSKKTLEQLVFRLFWTLTRKTCVFTGRFLSKLSILLSTCPEEQLQSNTSERKSWKLQDFRILFEVFGTMAEKNLAEKKEIDIRGNSLWKSFFQKRKFRYFFWFWAVFLLLAKTFARFAKPAIYVCVEVFGE